MQKKDNTLYWIIGAAIVAGAGYFIYTGMKNKDKPIEPPQPGPSPGPSPGPGPAPKPKPVGPAMASAAKIDELQKLMIRRFVQLNRSGEFDAAAAKGGWGSKSATALEKLQPQNFINLGNVNASNVDKWIAAIKKDVETAAAEQQKIQTKKTTDAQQIKLADALEKHLQTKGKKIRLLSDVTGIKHQYDNARGYYLPLGDTKKFYKGAKYDKDEIINRGNGTLGIKVGDFRYFIPASQFITD